MTTFENMAIELEKPFVVMLYCLCRQAELSVDATPFHDWAEFIDYFDQRKWAIRSHVNVLRAIVPENSSSRSGTELVRNALKRHLSRLIGPVANRMRTAWRFSADEVRFIASTLERFLGLLEHSSPPIDFNMVDIRQDLCDCESIIELHTYGMPEIKRAKKVEHFCQSSHLNAVTIASVCGEEIGGGAERRGE